MTIPSAKNIELGFESGTASSIFDSTGTTGGTIERYSYDVLAGNATPYRGRGCLRIDKTGVGGSQIFGQKTLASNIAAAKEYSGRVAAYVPSSVSNDAGSAIQLQFGSMIATATVELYVGVEINAANTELKTFISGTGGSQLDYGPVVPYDTWFTLEFKGLVDSGAGNDGTADLYVTVDGKEAPETADVSISSLDQGALTAFRMEASCASAWSGTVYVDEGAVMGQFDSGSGERIFPATPCWWPRQVLTQSRTLSLTGAEILDVEFLAAGNTDDVVRLFDTQNAVTADNRLVWESGAEATRQKVQSGPLGRVESLYAELSGTSPRVVVHLRHDSGSRRLAFYGKG